MPLQIRPKLTPQNRARRVQLRDLAEEGRISGMSDEEGETILDRLEAKYNAMLQSPKA